MAPYFKWFYNNRTCINSTWKGTKIINLNYSMKSAILHFKLIFRNMKPPPQFILSQTVRPSYTPTGRVIFGSSWKQITAISVGVLASNKMSRWQTCSADWRKTYCTEVNKKRIFSEWLFEHSSLLLSWSILYILKNLTFQQLCSQHEYLQLTKTIFVLY